MTGLFRQASHLLVILLTAFLTACGGKADPELDLKRTPLAASISSGDTLDLYRFFIIAFGAAPGTVYFNQALAAMDGGATVRQVVNAFSTKSQFTDTYPNRDSDAVFAHKLVTNVVGDVATDTAKQQAERDIVAALVSGLTRGDVVYIIFKNLAVKSADDPDWARMAKKLQNKVLLASQYTATMGGSSTNLEDLRAVVANVDDKLDPNADLTFLVSANLKMYGADSVKCGGGIGSGANTTQPTPCSVTTSTPVRFGTYSYFAIINYVGPDIERDKQVLAVLDVNDDGYDDILLTPMYTFSAARPVALFFNPALQQFEVNPQFQAAIPEMTHPREAAMVDFDGDGRKDLYIADHGYDDAPWGGQNILVLNKKTGFQDGTYLLPQVGDYTHGIVVADFWNTGREDILTLNTEILNIINKCQKYPEIKTLRCSIGPQEPRSYVLENIQTNRIPLRTLDAEINFSVPSRDPSRLMKGAAYDLNSDGIPDLALSYIGKIKILESAAIGKYSKTAEFFPDKEFVDGCNIPNDFAYGNVLIADLDGDGTKEVLTYYTCSWNNMRWQVLRKDSSGAWKDVTSRYFPDQSANIGRPEDKNWCRDIFFADINGDGKPDIICRTFYKNMFWLYDQKNSSFAYYDLKLTYNDGQLVNDFTNPFVMKFKDINYLVSARDILMGTVFVGWRIK